MLLALLVSLVCLDAIGPGPWPTSVSVVKHTEGSTSADIISGDAQCSGCPCWRTLALADPGCALVPGCQGPCGYWNIGECPDCIQWGMFAMTDSAGCIDMDRLPKPEDSWVFWVRTTPLTEVQ